ncbi:hypothetical protein MSG28_013041 [Choristoneura fumiferana]|uniref:Uncharacterized protein n=1 Tax=Choristoneura fumiferana TaxID=7141 RepID=A0ACC0KSB8_CHOFU|nr:hypothetical protein MSG28_013041 [Choristoneura fumiferana]
MYAVKTKDNQITRFPLTTDSVAQTRYRYHSNAPYLKSQDNDSPVTHAMYLLHPVRIAAQMSDRVYNSSYILSIVVESVKECAWQTVYCGLDVCNRYAAAQHLLAQPYPIFDVVITAPSHSRQCFKKSSTTSSQMLQNRARTGQCACIVFAGIRLIKTFSYLIALFGEILSTQMYQTPTVLVHYFGAETREL